jgi:transposase
MKKLAEDVINNPNAYQYERAERLEVSQAAVHFGLKRLGVTYKKNARTYKRRQRKACYVFAKNSTI